MKELSAIKDFILSLEQTQLTGDQQTVLFEGKSDYYAGYDASGCTNYSCINKTPDCNAAINSACINEPNCKCQPNTSCADEKCSNPTRCSGKDGSNFDPMGFPGFGI